MAPLSVFVDGAIATTGLTDQDFTNASFEVNFDSTNTDPLMLTKRRRGFLSAHVYTRPGIYQITMTVRDTGGNIAQAPPVTISVTDPEIAFFPPNGETYCFSTTVSNNFTGCPVTNPTNRIVTDNLQTALNYGGQNRRLLFRRGDTWNNVQSAVVPQGPQQIAAFPSPNDATLTTRPQIASAGGNWSFVLDPSGSSDVRISDFIIRASWNGVLGSVFQSGITARDSNRLTLNNLIIERTNEKAIDAGNAREFTIFASQLRDSGRYGLMGAADKLAVLENTIYGLVDRFHGIRVQNGSKVVVVGNSIHNNGSFTAVTYRGDLDQGVISDNSIQGNISFAPQNAASREYVSNILAEGNILRPYIDTSVNPTVVFQGMSCSARRVTIRNNLFINVISAISLNDHELVGGCEDVTINNNTSYKDNSIIAGHPTAYHTFLYVAPMSRRVVFSNNLFYSLINNNSSHAVQMLAPFSEYVSGTNLYFAPQQPSNWQQFRTSSATYSLNNWHAAGQDLLSMNVDPRVRSADVNNPFFMRLGNPSPAVDNGIGIFVSPDLSFISRPRDGDGNGTASPDIGAFERQSSNE